MVKIGFVSSALPELNGKALSDVSTAECLGNMEIQCWPTKRNKCNTYGYSQFEINDHIAAIGYYPNWIISKNGDYDNLLAHTVKLIDVAKELSVPFSTHAGSNNDLTLSQNIELLQKAFTPILRYAEIKQVQICMETSTYQNAKPFGTNVASTPDVWDMYLGLSPAAMLTLDTAQLHTSINNTINKYRDKIAHIHARDVRNGVICSPGIGEINWPQVLSSLDWYNGTICLEYDSENWTNMSITDRITEMHFCACMFNGTKPKTSNNYDKLECRVIDAALRYIDKGWNVVPVLFRNKESGLLYWPSTIITKKNAYDYFRGLHNVAISFGNGLVDVDIDHPKAIELAPKFLPPTGAVFGRKSKPKSHYLYYSPNAKSLNAKSWAVEIRCGDKAYTVAPPSMHINGELIEWDSQATQIPSEVDGYELTQAVEQLAEAALESSKDFAWPS